MVALTHSLNSAGMELGYCYWLAEHNSKCVTNMQSKVLVCLKSLKVVIILTNVYLYIQIFVDILRVTRNMIWNVLIHKVQGDRHLHMM